MACREDARAIIKRVMGCSDKDAVIFVGSGSTSASNLLVSKLKIKQTCEFIALRERVQKFLPEDKMYEFLAESMPPDLDAKQNCIRLDWNAYKCNLCSFTTSGLQLYTEHTKSPEHKKKLA